MIRSLLHLRERTSARFVARNLPIGTGVTQAACKALATQRMTCSGMAWRHESGQAILSLCPFIQSKRFDAARELLR